MMQEGNFIETFHFKEINHTDVYKLFKGLDTKTSIVEDKIPPKLVKLAAESLIAPLTNAINSSIRCSIFPHEKEQK